MTLEQVKLNISPAGISEHEMTGAWRVIIARRDNGQVRTWYFHANDAPAWRDALHTAATRWMTA
jgi:hypothetical protein